MYIAGSEDIVEASSKESEKDHHQIGISKEPTNRRTKLPTAGLSSFADGFTDID